MLVGAAAADGEQPAAASAFRAVLTAGARRMLRLLPHDAQLAGSAGEAELLRRLSTYMQLRRLLTVHGHPAAEVAQLLCSVVDAHDGAALEAVRRVVELPRQTGESLAGADRVEARQPA